MKNRVVLKQFILVGSVLLGVYSQAQKAVNWTEKQLMEPADLASAISTKKDVPVIISVGPGTTIPNTVEAGLANTKEGLETLKAKLKGLPKQKRVVIYCGCCPFEHCPNVRPAMEVLKAQGFTAYYLLNLPHNIKKDWIDKGYPVSSR